MSTDYFLIENKCKCCGRKDKKLIGNSSSGWLFKLEKTGSLECLEDWIPLLVNGTIEDEYKNSVSFQQMMTTVCARSFGCSGIMYYDELKKDTVVVKSGKTWIMSK